MSFQVLVIDDDVSFRKIIEVRLNAILPDAKIFCFGTLEAVRNYLTSDKRRVDLVILDEHLPDGRGIEFLSEGWFEGLAVLCVSSDTSPEIPGATIKAGAAYFLSKVHVSEPLFSPLVQGIIERNSLQHELRRAQLDQAILDTVRTLVATLRHEINNPLGAVLGAAYLLRNSPEVSDKQREVAELIESSGQRIKHVLNQLCDTISVEKVKKGNQEVFHVPGDRQWEGGDES
jgi:signal transduction histidine kinase